MRDQFIDQICGHHLWNKIQSINQSITSIPCPVNPWLLSANINSNFSSLFGYANLMYFSYTLISSALPSRPCTQTYSNLGGTVDKGLTIRWVILTTDERQISAREHMDKSKSRAPGVSSRWERYGEEEVSKVDSSAASFTVFMLEGEIWSDLYKLRRSMWSRVKLSVVGVIRGPSIVVVL